MYWKRMVFYLVLAFVFLAAARLLTALSVEPELLPDLLLLTSGIFSGMAITRVYTLLKLRGGTLSILGSILAILFFAGLLVFASLNPLAAKNPFNIWVVLVDLALLALLGFEIRALVKALRKK
ncbi:MAG: hypothetical protein UV83_C0005G0018 [candidate division WWE3 bacterium GW2011_GWE2_43_18]|nr:hypothetical protein P147_WWE3C00001G0589 [candidate division WWE3 bacterium RAAC2_WWE3_1]KKS29266.1 MAG: hypothetical protein UU91_C0007G0015 [candidate division WWE3 bacterium GW2011_GWB1_42_117]KKS54559.1 MAG: hypothetical protein UV21_C0006G0017 [candidate division WWE3 bacterium GW2011_GWD2_42_34]KKT05324.1 MAG: hypothetical protein UV83_C0005G0018 [candidate division WWE3 bacterium GW2011_GWE2_43_18]KKT06539.1 MAG: hypothetical protein UV84_C0006G0020 [candidate division WWE3 bacterium